MQRRHKDRARVIEFWRAVELFSPQNVPQVNRRARVYPAAAGDLLPWEAGHDLQRASLRPRNTWRHTVYGGIFPLQRVRERMVEEFGDDSESLDGRRYGDSALFALTVTHEGRPLLGTQEFSSCAWAIGRTVRRGARSSRWLDGFSDVTAACDEEFERLFAALDDDQVAADLNERLKDKDIKVGRPIGHDDLAELCAFIEDEFGCGNALGAAEVRVRSVEVSERRQFSEDSADFLNSFIADDLDRVAAAVRNGDYGAALDAYLRGGEEPDGRDRIDLRQQPGVMYERVAPALVPPARWPAKPEHALSLSQQFAVNSVLSDLAPAAGLFAVNGPPGTGKTTMLRDLVAAIVVERARRLADLPSPGAAFGAVHRWRVGDYQRVIRLWQPQLTGFEMVVASANNSAVENVSLETPRKSEIAVDWHGEAGYFAELATRVLKACAKDTGQDKTTASGKRPDAGRPGVPDPSEDAWGLLAARLGNKKNRREFVDAFWLSDKATDAPGMLDILKGWQTSPSPWREAVGQFRAAERAVVALMSERSDAFTHMAALPRLERQRDQQQEAAEQALRRLTEIRQRLAVAARPVADMTRDVADREQERRDHLAYKPGLFEALLSRRRLREWQDEDSKLAGAVTQARQRLQAAQNNVRQVQETELAARSDAERHQERLEALARQAGAAQTAIARAQEDLKDALPIADWWENEEQRELSAPWTDAAWNAARTRLFLAALELHRAFLAAEADQMRKNLHGAMDVLRGDVPPDAPRTAVRAAWQSLFFVVPLVSTTFASVDRVFSHLGRESLGWLFIDEAGQATPQQAVGALWRTQRAVIIGDPLQLEPVVTLPLKAQQALRRHFDVAEVWLPELTSTQRLADQANRYGTSLPTDDGSVWVGAPLRVHRR